MATLLLRLAGPMQSWGTQSRFTNRDTGLEPSLSGVIGLLCAALGKPREERAGDSFPALAQLASLRMGVRVDREGTLQRDYQTAGGGLWSGQPYGVRKADGSKGDTVLSDRFYLADADFLVGLEGENAALLQRLNDALDHPQWSLSLGRKALVPGTPVRLPDTPPLGPGLQDCRLLEALKAVLWRQDPSRPSWEQLPERLRVVADARAVRHDPAFKDGVREVRQDVPLCFVQGQREFGNRDILTAFWTVGDGATVRILQEV